MVESNNISEQFTEKDWKLFRKQIIIWQERYMSNLNLEYISILTREKNASDNFWELDKRIKRDKNTPGVILEMRRSIFIDSIVRLLNDGVISMGDLDGFSDQLKKTIQSFNLNVK